MRCRGEDRDRDHNRGSGTESENAREDRPPQQESPTLPGRGTTCQQSTRADDGQSPESARGRGGGAAHTQRSRAKSDDALPAFDAFAKDIRSRRTQLLAYFDERTTDAEGVINRIGWKDGATRCGCDGQAAPGVAATARLCSALVRLPWQGDGDAERECAAPWSAPHCEPD
jgi:hypothetical protein